MLKLLVVLAIAATPLVTSYHLDGNKVNNGLESNDRLIDKNSTILLKQFNILKLLGSGSYGYVYAARKIGGPDDGKLYALKVGNITHILKKEAQHNRDFIRHEREVLEMLRGLPLMIGLQYAWHEGNWLFLATYLVVGEPFMNRYIFTSKDDDAYKSTKFALAEIIAAFESLHSLQIRHGDFSFLNLLVDGDGHLVVIDFGWSERFVDTSVDWKRIAEDFSLVFPEWIDDRNGINVLEILSKMTDEQIPELKRHPYFDGIDWEKVAERKLNSPCKPYKFDLELEEPINLIDSLKIDNNEGVDADMANRLRNYTFIAPELQF